MPLEDLPHDIFVMILEYLHPPDIFSLISLNKHWYNSLFSSFDKIAITQPRYSITALCIAAKNQDRDRVRMLASRVKIFKGINLSETASSGEIWIEFIVKKAISSTPGGKPTWPERDWPGLNTIGFGWKMVLFRWAIMLDHKALVWWIVKEGVDMEDAAVSCPHGMTALHYALYVFAKRSFLILLKNGAEVNVRCSSIYPSLQGQTPLWAAVKRGFTKEVELLLDRGARADILYLGKTILHYAVGMKNENLVKCILKLDRKHIEIDSRVDIAPPGSPSVRATALFVAAEQGLEGIVRGLIRAGADVNYPNVGPLSRTPLHGATFGSNINIVDMLLNAGANIEARDKFFGNTALQCAVENQHPGIVKRLLEFGADINSKNKFGFTPLLRALRRHTGPNGRAIVQSILASGQISDPFMEDVNGEILLEMLEDYGPEDLATRILMKELPMYMDTEPSWPGYRPSDTVRMEAGYRFLDLVSMEMM